MTAGQPADLRRERVAKALYDHAMRELRERIGGSDPMRSWRERSASTRDEYRRLADAALAEIGDPAPPGFVPAACADGSVRGGATTSLPPTRTDATTSRRPPMVEPQPITDAREDVLDLERTPWIDPESTLEADEFYCAVCGDLTSEHPASDFLGRCPDCTKDSLALPWTGQEATDGR